MAIDAAGVGGGAKRPRGDEQGDRRGADLPVDRISALPEELRLRILTRLAYKDAIRTGALARGWRDLWKTRWAHRASVEVHLKSRDAPRRELDALEREPRPRRRLDRFSFVVDTSRLKSSEFQRFIEYAAECRAEDLHVETCNRTLARGARKLTFRLPQCSPLLARLSLRRIGIANRFYNGAQPFRALEVIRLHSVSINPATFTKMMSLCPNLLTLDLRGCSICDHHFWCMVLPATLRSVTVAHCDGKTRLDLVRVHSLRSFRYSCSFLNPPFLARDAVLSDLYIRFSNSMSGSLNAQEFNKALPNDLSALTVLTICNNALPVASSLYDDDGATAQLPKLRNLHGLRELHLLMLNMKNANLVDIYVFLKTIQCHNLERLFVQLPCSVCGPMESPLDVVPEEPPEDGLDNLAMVKVKNFNWSCAEVQLVSFLLRKAKSLQKLLIVSLNVTPPDGPGVQEADLFLKEALANGKIMLSKSDDAVTHPYHSAFINSF